VTLADALLLPLVYNMRRIEMPSVDFPKLIVAVDNGKELEAFKDAAPEAQSDAV
jgi:maleylpyruvate isomerase